MRFRAEWMLITLGLSASCRAQSGCFATPAQAVKRVGTEVSTGFRLESTLRDPLREGMWARVAQCGHSEWPVLLVRVPASAATWSRKADPAAPLAARIGSLPQSRDSAPSRAQAAVTAGGTVTVIQQSDLVQLQTAGVALSNAAVGDRVRVRLGNQQFVLGTVRGAGVVEIR
jgi:hypothetical protein